MKLTHLFFDAGNTLVYVNLGFVSEALARRGTSVSTEALWAAEHRVRVELDDPGVVKATNDVGRWTMYFEKIMAAVGVGEVVKDVLAEMRAYHSKSNLWEVVPPEVRASLDALRGRYRMSVISNANGTVRDKLERVGLAGYFETILDSHEEGVEKPDPAIFRRAMERTGAAPAGSLYVGDMYHIDVVGARAAGMEAVLLDPAGHHHDKDVRRLPTIAGLPGLVDSL
ncbi:MAG TPA: HAD family hydrolase [Planctomycetota bacterium]